MAQVLAQGVLGYDASHEETLSGMLFAGLLRCLHCELSLSRRLYLLLVGKTVGELCRNRAGTEK